MYGPWIGSAKGITEPHGTLWKRQTSHASCTAGVTQVTAKPHPNNRIFLQCKSKYRTSPSLAATPMTG